MALPAEYPFLSLQMNSLLRTVKNEAYDSKLALMPLVYQKPSAITLPIGNTLPHIWRDKLSFSQAWRKQIEHYITSYGLELKIIEDVDTPGIKEFLNRRYPKRLADEICAFDLYRFRKFGHGVLLHDQAEQVVGTIFEIGYHTEEHTSYTIRLAVDESVTGKNLGYHLMVYSSLLAMEHGSRVKRGLIEVSNLHSLYINLNKVGWICDGFKPHITDLGCFFEIVLPLDPLGLTGNVIDRSQLLRYIAQHREDKDYRLLRASDHEGIADLYQHTSFKVCAVLRAGDVHEEAMLFALPAEALRLHQ